MFYPRRDFLNRLTALGLAAGLAPLGRLAAAPLRPAGADPLAPELVQEFVGKAHSSLERVREILEQQPLALHATWDWGDGDFETALGAAGHVGRRDIAEFLLEKGGRADLFVLTMLGETAVVQAALERYPALLRAIGPHGFTLLHHAQRGGAAAQNLLDYLTEKGLKESFIDVFGKQKK